MTVLEEYLAKLNQGWGYQEFENELNGLIKSYNEKRKSCLLVYSSSPINQVPDSSLNQSDYYFIKDLLDNYVGKCQTLDIYLETPGGSGTTAEEIVKYIRSHFDRVNFIIAGEAKSAGTILAMSGDDIFMTESGSLGPIDAQMMIGRSFVSAFDHVAWIDEKREETLKNGGVLSPVDAVMLAQVSPGELEGAITAQEYAVEMVRDWLVKYKFKNWNETETNKKKVTPEHKKARAEEIANILNNHKYWKTHARSIKREDLVEIGLRIENFDDDIEIKTIVEKINFVLRMMFRMSTTYKLIATEKDKMNFNVAPTPNTPMPQQQMMSPLPEDAKVLELGINCGQCGKEHKLYAKFVKEDKIDVDMKKKGFKPFPKDNQLKCDCGFILELLPIRNQIEIQGKKKIA